MSLYVLEEGAEMAETSLTKRLSSVEWEAAGIMKTKMNIWHSSYREWERK